MVERGFSIFTGLILGESHTGKTRSISTLPGKSLLFNLDGPDNVTALRVPFAEVVALEDYWVQPFDFGKVLVVNYTAMPKEISLLANPREDKLRVDQLIKDINSVREHLDALASEEGPGNLVLETVGSLAEEVLSWTVASQGRSDTQIQDYKIAMRKVFSIIGSMMGYGLNVVVTGHLQAEKDEITGRSRITPFVWGKSLPEMIPRLFGEVFQSLIVSNGKGGIKYVWQTKPDAGGFIGFLGSRKFDGLPKFIEQNFGYLDKLAKEGGKK